MMMMIDDEQNRKDDIHDTHDIIMRDEAKSGEPLEKKEERRENRYSHFYRYMSTHLLNLRNHLSSGIQR
jgi:hypothetical protein